MELKLTLALTTLITLMTTEQLANLLCLCAALEGTPPFALRHACIAGLIANAVSASSVKQVFTRRTSSTPPFK